MNVLRLESGQEIVLFDGTGGEYVCCVRFEGKQALAEINEHRGRESELSGQITLAQGLAGGDKMDWIIEKAVELGVSAIAPVAARRSVVQLSGPRLEKRMLHWQRIIQAASEQCGRNRLASLSDPAPLVDVLEPMQATPDHLILLCDPAAMTSLRGCLAEFASLKAVTLLIGPEGGWSHDEAQIARDKGAIAVNFGSRVLRTETAGLALITAVSTLCGWA